VAADWGGNFGGILNVVVSYRIRLSQAGTAPQVLNDLKAPRFSVLRVHTPPRVEFSTWITNETSITQPVARVASDEYLAGSGADLSSDDGPTSIALEPDEPNLPSTWCTKQ